jgi:hypothetical protein
MGIVTRHSFPVLCLVLCAAGVSVSAHAALEEQAVRNYGGTYLSDCRNPQSPRVIVSADALVVRRGNKQLAGGNLQAAYSYFGQSPPPHYLVALLSEVRGNALMAVVYRDSKGQYLKVDGDPPVLKALGSGLTGLKYHLCGAPGEKPAEAAPPTKKYPLTEMSAPGLLMDARFKSAYYRALGSKRGEEWLSRLDGPSPTNKKIMIDGTEYILGGACENHDCYDNSVVLLYQVAQGRVYGRIYERGRVTFIGQPSATIKAELNRLWKAEWRQNQ